MKRPSTLFSLAWRGPVRQSRSGKSPYAAASGLGVPERFHSGRTDFLRRCGIRSLACFAALICLLWPAILNSQYIFFYDTTGYLRGAIQALHVTGIESDWSALYNDTAGTPRVQSSAPEGSVTASTNDGFISAARSVYYGALLYAGALLGSLWFGLLFQVLAVALAIYLTLDALLGPPRYELPLVLCLLGLFTPLSFFSSYLMPDVFAGIAILACAALLVLFGRLKPWMRSLWFALLSLSLVFHASFIAMAVLIAIIGALLVLGATGRFPWRGTGVVSAAVVMGLVSQAAFFWVVEAVYGHPPLRPPFLMARVIADGPGYDYLRATCPENGFKVCRFLPVLPLSADEFLWSKDPRAGVVSPADPKTRAALVAEQPAFVAAVLRYDFAGQAIASLKNFLEQLARFGVDEFRYSASERRIVLENLPATHHAAFKNSLLYRNEFPLAAINILFYFTFAASVLLLIWGLRRIAPGHRNLGVAAIESLPAGKTLWLFSLAVLGGIASNAAVTGILSTPHDRYQARVIWLVSLLALLVFLFIRKQRRALPASSRTKRA